MRRTHRTVTSRGVSVSRAVKALLLMSVATALMLSATSKSSLIHLSPGPTYGLSNLIEGPLPHAGEPTTGDFLLTTVSVTEMSNLRSTFERITSPQHITNQAASDTASASAVKSSMVAVSQLFPETAPLLATELGVSPKNTVFGLSDVITPNDVITGLNGTPISNSNQFISAMEQLIDRPQASRNAMFELDVENTHGETRTILGVISDQPFVGISLSTVVGSTNAINFDLPDVHGASGGLMMALTIVDGLFEGDLTGGKTIAGTGTLSAAGAVGDVDHAQYKLQGAERDGAELFFTPSPTGKNLPDTSIRTVEVATLKEAMVVLCEWSTDKACAALADAKG